MDKFALMMATDDVLMSGIPNPVVLVLTPTSKHAQRIAQDIKAGVVPAKILLPVADDGGSVVLVTAPDAASLLRKHAGKGGCYVAEMLDRLAGVDSRLVSVMPSILGLASYINGVEISRGATHYDHVDRYWAFEMVKDATVNLVRVQTPEGEQIPVCGPTGKDAMAAAYIVDVVRRRQIDLPMLGEMKTCSLNKEMLAGLLAGFRDNPRAIAEAIMALRKVKGNKDRWLTRALWGHPELRELAHKVHHELTGK